MQERMDSQLALVTVAGYVTWRAAARAWLRDSVDAIARTFLRALTGDAGHA
jgi:hypothetical protein